jgi:hypothetical protein
MSNELRRVGLIGLILFGAGCKSSSTSNPNSNNPCEAYLACLKQVAAQTGQSASYDQANALYGSSSSCAQSAVTMQQCQDACQAALQQLQQTGTGACGTSAPSDASTVGGNDFGGNDFGGSSSCALKGQSCAAMACCSGICAMGTCACTENGNCTQGNQCCSGICAGGVCAPCNAAGSLCQGAANCCSGSCVQGVCVSPPDMTATGCGTPGFPGNSVGVGRYCKGASDCQGVDAAFCATLVVPADHFCTKPCKNAADPSCGENAACACGGATGGSCACLPNGCHR